VSRTKRPPDEGRLLQLVYYGYVAFSAIARALPEKISYGLAMWLGGVGARRSKRRSVVAQNIGRIVGEPPESERVQSLVDKAYRSYARYWLETFAHVRESKEFFLERFICPTQHNIDEVLARGKGAIVAVGHLGNWDAAGAWVGARGNLLVTVAEVLRPRRMFDFFVRHRESLGMRIIPAAPGATDRLAQAVEEGAVVAILGDRDLKNRGPVVDFCGEPAHLPPGPAVVALRTGVPLLVGGVFSIILPDGRRGWEAVISEPIELPDAPDDQAVAILTQKVADMLGDFVKQRPEEWHVFQPFWKADRDREEARREDAAPIERDSN
jgi:KDO2-lipid IV(A) lauroyltransferase